MSDTRALSLNRPTQIAPTTGTVRRQACGHTTLRTTAAGDMPSAWPAWICPAGTAVMPARNASATNDETVMVCPIRPDWKGDSDQHGNTVRLRKYKTIWTISGQ